MHRFKFGDNRKLCEELTALVLAGKKTGTCWPHRDVATGEPMVEVGERSIYTDWDGNDVCMVEYTKIEIMPFNEVSEEFALSEGENDTRDGWARDHRMYYERNGGWSEDMMLVCENFRLVEVFKPTATQA
ncbi:MAG: ASCH domain-containing protein [Pseudomonadota bacterium]